MKSNWQQRHSGRQSQQGQPLLQDTVVDNHSHPSAGSLVSYAKQQIPHMTAIMHLFTQPKHLTLPLRRNALEAINRLCSTFHRHGIRSNSFSKVSYFWSLISTPIPFLPPLQTTSPDAALHFQVFSHWKTKACIPYPHAYTKWMYSFLRFHNGIPAAPALQPRGGQLGSETLVAKD